MAGRAKPGRVDPRAVNKLAAGAMVTRSRTVKRAAPKSVKTPPAVVTPPRTPPRYKGSGGKGTSDVTNLVKKYGSGNATEKSRPRSEARDFLKALRNLREDSQRAEDRPTRPARYVAGAPVKREPRKDTPRRPVAGGPGNDAVDKVVRTAEKIQTRRRGERVKFQEDWRPPRGLPQIKTDGVMPRRRKKR